MAKELTERQKKFIDLYVETRNATQSYIDAGYDKKNAMTAVQQLLKNVKVRQAIGDRIDEQNKSLEINSGIDLAKKKERLIKTLFAIAEFDYTNVCRFGPSGIDFFNSDSISAEHRVAIKELSEITTAAGTSVSIKAESKLKAIELLMKHLGMLDQKIIVSGDQNNPIRLTAEQLSPQEKKEKYLQHFELLKRMEANGLDPLRPDACSSDKRYSQDIETQPISVCDDDPT